MASSVISAQQSTSVWEKALDASISAVKTMWDRVQKEGRPLATKLVKAAPDYYKRAQKMLGDFTKRVEASDFGKTTKERKEFALELWKLRSAINVMALTDPAVLEQLTGVKPDMFKKMLKSFGQTEAKVKKIQGS
jgi:phage-related minor tail protein